ncbi:MULTISPECIES: formylmethanofuran dehydrogenase subunit C [Rhodomicrobium]|uniref:formylmethanofuran dehydrogenase subunit C n=1 Tax=Rhodomicrobium TaxID=1068 RepID=UPI000B4AD112|nr:MULTISPECIES: formylmethanofuran dehydrogenase subunit C [Rhodomicrobium]
MSAMIFTLRFQPEQRLDLSCLTADRLDGLSEKEILALPVSTTKQPLALGELFRVTMGEPGAIRIQARYADGLDNIGLGMRRGSIVVEGGAGAYAGRRMSGGSLTIEGDVGPFAASGMTGGRLRVEGDAGDFLGGPRSGEAQGMSGGVVVVTGRAGARAGDRMRRGVIAIGGDAGDCPGSRMIAGVLAVFGNCGERPGTLMRRGTIVLGGEAAGWPPTFVENGAVELVTLHILATELKDALPPSHLAPLKGRVRKLAGDMAVLGKGEILRLAV